MTFMSHAAQGIEIGSGFSGSRMLGSEHNDEFYMEDGHVRTRTNRCAHDLCSLTSQSFGERLRVVYAAPMLASG